MEIVENVKKLIQDMLIPEIEVIKGENAEIKTILQLTNKRIDDINTHLIDQSRRIDETNKRIDETNKRIDELRVELKSEIAQNTARIDETNKRIDELRVELKSEIVQNTARIDETNKRIDETNKRIDHLYERVVKKEDHDKIELRVVKLEYDVSQIKERIYKIAA